MNTKKNIILRIIFTSLLVATCLMIFYFSSQTGSSSGTLSKDVMRKIAQIFTKNEVKIEQAVLRGEPILRKIAHFSIYSSLGFWAMCMMQTYFKNKEYEIRKQISSEYKNKTIKEKNKAFVVSIDFDKIMNKRIWISILIGFLYSISDELHQAFVSNRTGRVIDVVLDTIGVANGALIISIIVLIINYNRKKI